MRSNCNDCGKCCEYLLLVLKSEDHARWVRYHGVEITHVKGVPLAKIPTPCTHLTEDKRCAVHGTDEMPEICKMFVCSALDPRGIPVEGVE